MQTRNTSYQDLQVDNVNITQGKSKHIFVQVLYRNVIRVDNALGAAERKNNAFILCQWEMFSH